MFDFNLPKTEKERTDELLYISRLSRIIAAAGFLVFISYKRGNPAIKMGKHADRTKISLNARLAWMTQECPSFIVALLVGIKGNISSSTFPNKVILSLFVLHYFNRSFIYTFRMSNKSTPVSIGLAVFAFLFTFVNGYNISKYLTIQVELEESWKYSFQFITGVAIWLIGFIINNHSDHILLNLRKPGETGYKIPRGGVFEFVSGANFFGEIVEWWGLAIASNFQLPIMCFAISTTFTIGCRACSHHRFYLEKFDDYPKTRRAWIPFIL